MIESLPVILGGGLTPDGRLANRLVSRMPTAIGDIDNLPQALTIGETDYAPCAYLVADDINQSTGAWASRHDATKTLAVAGTGADPTYGKTTAITNTSVKYAAAKYHAGADMTWGQITTGDFALEITYKHTSGSKMLVATFGNTPGYEIFINSTSLTFYSNDTAARTFLSSTAVAEGTLNTFLLMCDKSDKFYTYRNGVYVSSAEYSPQDTTSTYPIHVGIRPDGIWALDSEIIHFGVWNFTSDPFPGAATNRAVMDAIAASRFATIAGIGCQKNTTYSFSRASSAYLDRYTTASRRSLFSVSSGWPRVCERKDSAGETVTGYLSEPQCTNDFLYSEDFSQAATWEPTRCTVGSNATEAPDGTNTADSIIADDTDNTHYLQQTTTSSAGVNDIFSVWLKGGACTWARIDTHIATNAYAYFDLGNGAAGAVGADTLTSGVQDWGNGWYRCWISYVGGVASHTHHIHPCTADDDQTFAGNGVAASIYVWGAQHENDGTVIPTSYIKTAAAAATRIKDSLTRTIPAVATGKIAVQCTTLLGPSHNSTQTKTIVAVDDLG